MWYGQDAFRFEYTAFNTNGLEKKGVVIGLIDDEKGLNLVVYEAGSRALLRGLAGRGGDAAQLSGTDPSGPVRHAGYRSSRTRRWLSTYAAAAKPTGP